MNKDKYYVKKQKCNILGNLWVSQLCVLKSLKVLETFLVLLNRLVAKSFSSLNIHSKYWLLPSAATVPVFTTNILELHHSSNYKSLSPNTHRCHPDLATP